VQLTKALAPFDPSCFARLNGPPGTPVALALSGGGDSLALLLAASLWAGRADRRLIALTVDHRLRAESADWARFAADRAARLGVAHRTLVWEGAKPAAGLQAAARAARHALLADAARAEGAHVILMGHTADDVMEAASMRRAGVQVAAPRSWSPSPAWPQGRGLFLHRPFLGVRRAALRDWLEALGERWIDDPANEDARFARTRARRRLTQGETVPADSDPPAECVDPTGIRLGLGGDLTLSRDALVGPAARRLLAALCLCASGATRPPRGLALDRLLAQLALPHDMTASLAGARIEARGQEVSFCREPGEFARAGTERTSLPEGESVFDGRFELFADESGWTVGPLKGSASRLAHCERQELARLPASVRGALPAVRGPDGRVTSPVLAGDGPVRAHALAGERLFAALGGVSDEASLWRVAKWGASP
jgi:tRNA(Ile)-lysidine synthase